MNSIANQDLYQVNSALKAGNLSPADNQHVSFSTLMKDKVPAKLTQGHLATGND